MLTTVPLLIIDDLGMRKLPLTAAEELLEIIMRRYERASTLLTSNQTRRRLGQTAGRQRRRHRHAGSLAASRTRSQVRPAQLAHQNRRPGRRPMTKSKGKGKSDMDAGQRTPGGVATRDPEASHDGASP